MKNLLLLFFTFFIFADAFAQYYNFKYLGDKEFKNKNYYQAAYYYNKAATINLSRAGNVPFYSSGKTSGRKIKAEHAYIYYKLAESYRLYQNYTEAELWYNKILTENYGLNYPLATLWYGVCLRANKHFDESIKELQQFIGAYKGDSKFIDIANHEISTCLFAKQQYLSHPLVTVTKMQERWNADAGDYALIKNGENYWFTSSRFNENNKKHLNSVYMANAASAYKPVMIKLTGDNPKKDIEYGTPSIDQSGKRMDVTGWYKQAGKFILAIYCSTFENNNWSPLKKLNSNVNAEGFNALQPCITNDGKRLFFVSDKPGGQGGDDIWVSDLDDEGNPVNSVNLGETVNTPFDEQAPFYDPTRKRLVYSSKGFIGLGGFDFFESYENDEKWSAAQNLGFPINSSKDDLYYYNDPTDSSKFYISSDRASECCLNLFELNYKPVFISGKIVDCHSNKTLNDISVSLVDSASGKTLQQVATPVNGSYNFRVLKKSPLKLFVEKAGYFKKNISISAGKDTLLVPDICLTAIKINKPFVLKGVLYDFNSANLRPESKIALDSLVIVLNDNPGMKIEISSHTDSIGNNAYNLKLSNERAQSCVDYIISKNINKDRVSAKGYGRSKPIAPNSLPDGGDNPVGRQLNRRTEFIVKDQ